MANNYIKMNDEGLNRIITESVNYVLLEKQQKERKEQFRLLHKRAENLNEDVMNRFYGICSNRNRPVRIDETTLDRIINKHGDNGLVCVSAWRSDMSKERNEEKTKMIIADLNRFGYSYLPTYGGYKGTDGVTDEYEPSFYVFNHLPDGKTGDFGELRAFAIEMCNKYEQNSVLIKAPGQPPIYVNGNGDKVNKRESNKVIKNDPNQFAFTSLKSKEEVDKEVRAKLMGRYKTYCHRNNVPVTKDGFEKYYSEHLNDIDFVGKRFSYDITFGECYVNPMPCQITERLMRNCEVMVWK